MFWAVVLKNTDIQADRLGTTAALKGTVFICPVELCDLASLWLQGLLEPSRTEAAADAHVLFQAQPCRNQTKWTQTTNTAAVQCTCSIKVKRWAQQMTQKIYPNEGYTTQVLSICDKVFFRKPFTCLYLSQNYETNLQNIQTNITDTQIIQKDTQREEGFY